MSTITVSTGLPAPRPRAVGAARQVGQVTLTRRGRLVMAVLALAVLVVAAVLASGGVPATAGTGAAAVTAEWVTAEPVPAERVTVRPGETLWAIAEREAPGVDPRETIARILDLNALGSASIEAGSVLLLPKL